MAHRTTNTDISHVVIDGRDEGALDGFALDNCDAEFCQALNFKGAGAILSRSTAPNFFHADMPTLFNFHANHCGDGVQVVAVDWNIEFPRICGFTNHGIDVWQGNLHCRGGHVYGGKIGARVRPGVALCDFSDTQLSDTETGFLIQGNETSGKGLFCQHSTSRGVLVGAQAMLSNLRINPGDYFDKITGAYGIEFANRTDATYGPLCGNWSQLHGAAIVPRKGSHGILLNAHMVDVSGVTVTGDADSNALVIEQPVDGARVDVACCGPGVVIKQLGMNCNINIRYHQTRPRIELPADWNDTSIIRENGRPVKPKGKGANG